MKRRFRLVLTFPLLLMSVSAYAALRETMMLKIGESDKLAGGTSIKFVSVVEDSRCPEGANCVWAGRAILQFELERNGAEPKRIDLVVGNTESFACVGKDVVRAEKLVPYPKAEKGIASDAYTATISIDRAEKKVCD